MSNFAPLDIVRPYRMIAGQAFGLGWGATEEDGTAYGAPLDVSTVTDVQVVATQRVARGLTPPSPTVWTLSNAGGVYQATGLIGSFQFPFFGVIGVAPAAGVYDVDVLLLAGEGQDWWLRAVFEVSA